MLIMIAEIIDFPHKEVGRKLFYTIIRERSGGKVKWDSYTCPRDRHEDTATGASAYR